MVDDDALSAALQSHLVSLLGHRAAVLSDPAQAIESALAGEFDLLLLDLGMPDMDGFEVLRRLREREQAAGRLPMPVIAVTGYASEADRLRCLMAGFTDHLSKPIHAASLDVALRRALGKTADRAAADGQRIGLAESDAERLRAAVQRLAQVKPHDRSFGPTVMEEFAISSQQKIERLQQAAAARDADQCVRDAHSLRSAAEFLGVNRLSSMCAEIEHCARAEDWERLEELIAAVVHEHHVVLSLLFESAR